VVRLQYDRLQDWEFKQKIRAFRDEALSRLPVSEEERMHEWIETETDTFINKENLGKFKQDDNGSGMQTT
jgi:hypothetical protein